MNLSWIKKVYLYLVSLISLVIMVIAGIILINLAIKTWVFPKADNNIYYGYCPVITETTPESEKMSQPKECTDETYAKEQRTSQKQRDASQAIAMILVAAPVFLYHWKLARHES